MPDDPRYVVRIDCGTWGQIVYGGSGGEGYENVEGEIERLRHQQPNREFFICQVSKDVPG